MVDASGEEECCAICFEHRPFIALPCSCHINYCAACWDRALATSVSVRGRAQCPSCRTAFHVDFNPEEGGLVFSRDSQGTASCEWKSQLYGKAKPVQIRLLRSFGASLASRAAADGQRTCREAHGGSCADKVKAGSACCDAAEAESSPSGKSPARGVREQPVCVCGAFLERISSHDRILRMLEDADPQWRSRIPGSSTLVERLLSSSLVTCDICEHVATRSGALWTCKNGSHTVLHPASYDVCERCFARYAGHPAAALHDGREGLRSPSLESVGCCQSCAAAVRSVMPWNWGGHGAVPPPPVALPGGGSRHSRARRLAAVVFAGRR